MDDSSNVIVLQKEELDGIVSDLTHSFATPKESKDVLRINKIKEDYEQYFHKTQLEIKQMIKDCTVRVRKAEAATKVPYDNYESMSTTLKKQIGATERSTTAAENKISELKEMHEQVSNEILVAAESDTQLKKVARQTLPHDRRVLRLYESMTNTVWDYNSPNIKGFISLPHDAQAFDWNPTAHSSFDTCNSLWDLLDAL